MTTEILFYYLNKKISTYLYYAQLRHRKEDTWRGIIEKAIIEILGRQVL